MFRSKKNRRRPAGLVLIACLFLLWTDREGRGEGLPFDATVDLPGLGEGRKAEKGAPFAFLFCLHAGEAGVEEVEITLDPPPEVDRLGGALSWKGALPPKDERCLDVALQSRTGMEGWSRPLQARMKLTYQGMAMVREVRFSDKGLEDTDFVSK